MAAEISALERDVQRQRAEAAERAWYAAPPAPKVDDWQNPFECFDASVHADAVRAHAAVKAWAYAVSRKEPRGLFLWSAAHAGQSGYGCGKTHLARLAFEFLQVVADFDGQRQRVTLLNAAEFYGQIRDLYAQDRPEWPLFEDWGRGHFILDDFGKEYVKDESVPWAREKFYRLIDRLYDRHGLLITSNQSPADAERFMGGASWSRLLGMCGPDGFIDLSAVPDYRLRKGGF